MAVYNSKEVSVTVNGITITGFAEDMVKIEPVEKEKVKTVAGAQGDYAHSKNHDERHKITLSLWQSSPSVAVLQTLSDTGSDFAVSVKNTSDGKYTGSATSCVISERVAVEFGKEVKAIQWVIVAADWKGAF